MSSPKSILKVFGSDGKAILKWMASPQGRKIEGAVEQGIEVVYPPPTWIINLINKGAGEAFKIEALAASSGGATPDEKAAALVGTLTPDILDYAKKAGLPLPTADKIQKLVDQIVGALNVFDGKV